MKMNRRSAEHQRTVEERRRSSASAKHDSRPKRLRTRGAAKRRAITEQE